MQQKDQKLWNYSELFLSFVFLFYKLL